MVLGVNQYPKVDVNALNNKYSLQNTFGSNIRIGKNPSVESTGGVETTVPIGGADYSIPNIASPKADPNLAYEGFRETLPGNRVTYKAVGLDINA